MTAQTYQASCSCEAVKVVLQGQPSNVIACHCSNCRKASGPLQTNAAYLTKDIEIVDPENKLQTYHIPKTKTGSGHEVVKGFCGNCGTALYNQPLVLNGAVTIMKTNVIDIPEADAGFFKPQAELFTKNRLPYVSALEGAAQFEGSYPA